MSDGGPEQPKLKVDRLARAMAAARVRAQGGEPPSTSATPPDAALSPVAMASPPSTPDAAAERSPGPEARKPSGAPAALAFPAADWSPDPEVPEPPPVVPSAPAVPAANRPAGPEVQQPPVASAPPAPGRLLLTPDQMRIPPAQPPQTAEPPGPAPSSAAAGPSQPVAGAAALSDPSPLAAEGPFVPVTAVGSDPAPPAGVVATASDQPERAGQRLFSAAAAFEPPRRAEQGLPAAPTAGSDPAAPVGAAAAASEPPARAGQGLFSAARAVPSDPPRLAEEGPLAAPAAAGLDPAPPVERQAAASDLSARGGQRLFAAAAAVSPEPQQQAPHPAAAAPEPPPLRKPALPALLSLTDVQTDIGRYHVLDGVSFEVPTRGVTMLLGRNGAGKTTTLRTIMGLWRAKAGRIRLGGLDIAGWPPHRVARQGVGYVPEDMGIFGALTVAENMRLAATAGAIPQERLDAIFRIFPALRTFWHGAAGNLSGGQKQMLALARVMVEKRQLYLIDEPTKGLAPAIVATLIAALRELKLQGATILMVEQNLAVARALGDSCVVMDDGKVAWRGPMAVFAADDALQARLLGLDLERT